MAKMSRPYSLMNIENSSFIQLSLTSARKKIISDYGLDSIFICTDAGLSSNGNRRFNDHSINGERTRSFITTQSVKQLPAYIKDFVLDTDGWHLSGDDRIFSIDELDESDDYDRIYYT